MNRDYDYKRTKGCDICGCDFDTVGICINCGNQPRTIHLPAFPITSIKDRLSSILDITNPGGEITLLKAEIAKLRADNVTLRTMLKQVAWVTASTMDFHCNTVTTTFCPSCKNKPLSGHRKGAVVAVLLKEEDDRTEQHDEQE